MSVIRTRRRVRPDQSTTTSPLGLECEARAAAIADNHRLQVAYLPIDDVKEPNRKLRRYSKRQLAALKASVTEFGLNRPILVDKHGTIIAGVALWLTAKELGHKSVPVIRIEHLTPEQVRLYRIADNKLQMGEWDEEELKLEFLELGELAFNTELKLDLEVTGFNTREIDEIVLKEKREPDEKDDKIVPPKRIAISRQGDLWVIGERHKVLCANSSEEESVATLMDGELAQMIVCDGPFNCPIRGFVSSRKDAREFAFGVGEMSSGEFINFERNIMRHLVKYSIDGSIHYHFIDWRSVYEMLAAGREEYKELKNILVWVKTNASRGWYRSQHELCCVFKNGTAPHITTFAIEEGARWRSNVLLGYPGCNSFGANRDEDLADHPTVKNQILISDLLRDCSTLGGAILDPFGGSGTTLLAAEHTGRRARLIEIDPLYVDVIIRRAAKRCGLAAVLAATGQSFEEVARERLGDELVDGEDLLGLEDGDEPDFDDDLGDEEAIDG